MKFIRIDAVSLLIAFLISGCQATSTPTAPVVTPTATRAPSSGPTVTATGLPALPLPPPDEASRRISVPPGFAIRIFAQGLNSPRLMAFGPDGVLHVAVMGAGQIVRLPDRNHDGIADGIEIVAKGLGQPHNLEFHDDAWYVAERDRIEKFDVAWQTRELVTDNIPCCGGHFTRTLHFGPDGKLYVSTGSSTNINPETDPRRAAILRFNPDGSIPADNPFASDPDKRKQAVWASGLRNSVDFVWTRDGQLWASMNGSDGISDDAPPEAIVIPIQKGKTYGWPYCYTPASRQTPVRDTRVPAPPGFDCAQITPALLVDMAHAAPLGMSFVNGKNFPASMQNDLFVAYHGSWDTDAPANYRDCKVQRIVIENGMPVRSETFATGWRAPDGLCGSNATYGRPADVIFGPDGAMYISDDKNGRVYRVIYTGK
jgi:glucose/arabinose dehydrogenase